MPVPVQVREREAARRTRSAEGRAPLEVAGAVVEEDEVAGPVVPRGDVEVAVPVEIRQRGRVGAVLLVPQSPGQREAATPVVEEDPVLLGPVPAVGHHDVERAVAVHIAQVDGRREVRCGAEGSERPECSLLRPAQTAGGRQGRDQRSDGDGQHRGASGSAPRVRAHRVGRANACSFESICPSAEVATTTNCRPDRVR